MKLLSFNSQQEAYDRTDLDGFIWASDKGNEEAENHVDEEADKSVQVQLAEEPHQVAVLLHCGKGHKHVIPVDEGEKALGHLWEGAELKPDNQTN